MKAKSRVRRAAAVPSRAIVETARIDPALLRVLADPMRSFIVYSVTPEAKTAKTLAAEMGCPTTRLYYHLQQLEKHGLVFVDAPGWCRASSRSTTAPWRATSAWMPGAFGSRDKPDRRRTEALLGFVFDQTRVEIGRGIEAGRLDFRRRAPTPGALMAYRNVLKLSPDAGAAAVLRGCTRSGWSTTRSPSSRRRTATSTPSPWRCTPTPLRRRPRPPAPRRKSPRAPDSGDPPWPRPNAEKTPWQARCGRPL